MLGAITELRADLHLLSFYVQAVEPGVTLYMQSQAQTQKPGCSIKLWRLTDCVVCSYARGQEVACEHVHRACLASSIDTKETKAFSFWDAEGQITHSHLRLARLCIASTFVSPE